jgi:hypothetical protein
MWQFCYDYQLSTNPVGEREQATSKTQFPSRKTLALFYDPPNVPRDQNVTGRFMETTKASTGLAGEQRTTMETTNERRAVSKGAFWGGWVMSLLPVAMLLMSGVMKVAQVKMVVEGLTKSGYPSSAAVVLGIVELTCTILYLIPRTSILGAILLTGYLGGAVDSMYHIPVNPDPNPQPSPLFPAVFGVLVWGGLFLRDPRIRDLIPFRKSLK